MSRPLAIARSHADAGVMALLVVATDGREWVVHRVAGAAADSATVVLRGPVDAVRAELPAVAAGIELVVIDAPAQRLRPVMRTVASLVGAARIIAVDPALLDRFGAHRPLPPVSPPISAFTPRRVRRWPAVATVLVIAAGAAGGIAVARPRAAPVAPVAVGGVHIDVPGQWRRTDLTAEPAPRAVFADPVSGSRIIVAISPLRGGATAESVAASLAERIRQRGDDAVSDFAARASFAGHPVTAYRETPDSGAPIRWYVRIVDVATRGRVQVSIGCQDSGAASAEKACRRAVASAAD